MLFLIVAAALGLIPAKIAQGKGHNFLPWYVFGFLLFIVALPVAFAVRPSEERMRQCPLCRTWIDRAASVCRQCSREVPPAEPFVLRSR